SRRGGQPGRGERGGHPSARRRGTGRRRGARGQGLPRRRPVGPGCGDAEGGRRPGRDSLQCPDDLPVRHRPRHGDRDRLRRGRHRADRGCAV
ncbi:MAG: hypothetical protein AVDCRST_MAG48-323, partial [uncultured Friedmanniella sp.]